MYERIYFLELKLLYALQNRNFSLSFLRILQVKLIIKQNKKLKSNEILSFGFKSI